MYAPLNLPHVNEMWRATAQLDAVASTRLSSTTTTIVRKTLTLAPLLAPEGTENGGRIRILLVAFDLSRRLSGTTLAQFSAVGCIVAAGVYGKASAYALRP